MKKNFLQIRKAYADIGENFARYRLYYGGIKFVFISPYFHFSFLISLITYQAWATPRWPELVISIIPSVLGFALGGYAILIAIGDEKFRSILAGPSERSNVSPFLETNAAFVHFILTQFLSLIYAIIYSTIFVDAKSLLSLGASWVGHLLFIYALFTAIAATMRIFRMAYWYDLYQKKSGDN